MMIVPFLKNKLLLLICILALSEAGAQKPAQTIPAFSFSRLDGKTFTNKDLDAGRLSFICFFDVSCDHCQHAIQKISTQYAGFAKTSMYLVTIDNPDGIRNFMGHYGPNLSGKKNVTILRDTRNEFIHLFHPVKYPSMFLYSRDKKLIMYDDNPDNVGKFLQKIRLAAN
jgi:peroxiredoxin